MWLSKQNSTLIAQALILFLSDKLFSKLLLQLAAPAIIDMNQRPMAHLGTLKAAGSHSVACTDISVRSNLCIESDIQLKLRC